MSRTLALARLLPDIADVGDIAVSGLVLDSRDVRPGDAFVCVAGFGAHGLNFVEQARANGAVAILYDHPAPAGLAVPADAICRQVCVCVSAATRRPLPPTRYTNG